MNKTSIEWTGVTVNPIRARWKDHNRFRSGHYCEKVSQGCANCYSSEQQPRFGMPHFQHARGDENIEHFLEPKVLHQVLNVKKPTQIFWCSMTDMFGRWVPNEWIAACFGVMAATPQHIHQVLTKRAERLPKWFEWVQLDTTNPGSLAALLECAMLAADVLYQKDADNLYPEVSAEQKRRDAFMDSIVGGAMTTFDKVVTPVPWPLPNVHLGVSCEDQQTATARIPRLLQVPAAVRWVSAEPLLGPVDLSLWLGMSHGIDWVVPGGESGRRARICQLEWIRSIVRQCRAAGKPVLVKQLGRDPREGPHLVQLTSRKGGDIDEFPIDLQVREYPV